MKEMTIEKWVELQKSYDRIEQLQCVCHLNYQHEQTGVRAIGGIQLKGVGYHSDVQDEINEFIDLDILAPFDKLDYNYEFNVDLVRHEYNHNGEVIQMKFDFEVIGLIEEQIQTPVEKKEFDIVDSSEEKEESATLEDLLDDSDNIKDVIKYFVVSENDTYESIARARQIQEAELRKKNANKLLRKGVVLLLPS